MNSEKNIATPHPSVETVIEVTGLHKSFDSKKVLVDLSLDLKQGENLVILGKSGSGKSVLIKCIIGLIKPDSGRVNVLGQDIAALDSEETDQLRARVGFLFQNNALYDSMTIRENLEFPMRRHMEGLNTEQMNEKTRKALEDVGLVHTIDMVPAELSGGMRKRIALARTLILEPEIILYDEPTTGLDPVTGKEISTLIREVQQKYNTSSIIISHDMNCVKISADRIAVLIDGACYAQGSYEELARSGDHNINQFFE